MKQKLVLIQTIVTGIPSSMELYFYGTGIIFFKLKKNVPNGFHGFR